MSQPLTPPCDITNLWTRITIYVSTVIIILLTASQRDVITRTRASIS